MPAALAVSAAILQMPPELETKPKPPARRTPARPITSAVQNRSSIEVTRTTPCCSQIPLNTLSSPTSAPVCARAERAGIVYVDIWDGFVDESGRYVSQGPDFEGQTRRLRTGDGVHFTKAGAVKLAQFVAQALRRVMNNRLVPVALPVPDDTPKPGVNGPRPAVGPVLPLTAAVSNDGGNLLGDSGRSAPANTDPVATRVLTHGDPITPPSGRADDFSWPHPDVKGSAEIEQQPPVPAPAAPAKGLAAKPDAKKVHATRNQPAKPAPNPPQPPAAARPAPRASLDGGPKPPRDVGGGF